MEYRITNIVCTANCNHSVDLGKMSVEEKNCQYDPEEFSGIIMKFEDRSPKVLIFRNGKVVIAGSKTENEIKSIIELIEPIINKYKVDI